MSMSWLKMGVSTCRRACWIKRSSAVGIPSCLLPGPFRDFDAPDRLRAVGPLQQVLPLGRPVFPEMGTQVFRFHSRRRLAPRRWLLLA